MTAKRQLSGMSAVVIKELRGGRKEALDFVNRPELFAGAVSLDSVESLVEHPASMTHSHIEQKDSKDARINSSVGFP